jgi:predicted PurR-regulated permease PerM
MSASATAPTASSGQGHADAPDRGTRIAQALQTTALAALGLLLVVAAVYALRLLGTTGLVILASILITYLITPIVDVLRRRMPRAAALGLTYALLAAIFAVVLVVVVPRLLVQTQSLITNLPQALTNAQRELADPQNPVLAKLPPDLRRYVSTLPTEVSTLVANYGFGVAQATLAAFFSIATLFMSLVIVPIFSAYLFFDASEVKRGFVGMIPAPARPRTLAILSDLNATIGAFVRGQTLNGAILGTLVALMLAIMHVRYALLLGVAVGILNVIPYLGAFIGVVPAVLLALIFNGWQNALLVGVFFGIIQQINGNIILPRVMKNSVELSPLVIIAAILIFSALFGIVGAFLAVPVAAMLRVFKLHFAPAPPAAEMAADEKQALPLREVIVRP